MFDVALVLRVYYIPSLFIFGFIGNGLTICVFLSKEWRKASLSLYLVALATSDTGLLLTQFQALTPKFRAEFVQSAPGLCAFIGYSTRVFGSLSTWFVSAFTIERFVAVCYPLRRKSFCTVNRYIKNAINNKIIQRMPFRTNEQFFSQF